MNNFFIKGVNLGGWLLMEGYLLGGRNIPESEFKEKFRKKYGQKELILFEKYYRKNFINERDFFQIKNIGANTIRVPFHYKLLEKAPYKINQEGLLYFKDIFSWAGKYNLKVILDLHAACGSQNSDWHSDSKGDALLWEKEEFRERMIFLWKEIVSRFKDEIMLLGYDLLNEPIVPKEKRKLLINLYRRIIREIKKIDNKHLIFLEGDLWAQRIDFLKELIEENVWISIHCYQPLDYTFNFVPFYYFPGKVGGEIWNRDTLSRHLENYYLFSLENKTSIYVGEFGINWRGGYFGEKEWLSSIVEIFKKFNFGYTYWTYKGVNLSVFPTPLYHCIENNKYVRREGPVFGWENYLLYWDKEKEKIKEFWKNSFFPLESLIKIIFA